MEELILLRLGYTSREIASNNFDWVALVPNTYRTQRANELMVMLDEVDAKIAKSEEDAVIGKTCENEFDWYAHLRYLRRRGQDVLEELSRLLDIGIRHSKYVRKSNRSFISYQ
jgi:hypothetical protein